MVPNDRKLQRNLCSLLTLTLCCHDWEWREAKTSKQDMEKLIGTASLEPCSVVSRSEITAASHNSCSEPW